MSLHSVSVALSDLLPLEFCFVVLKEGRKELESHSRVLFADGWMGYVCVFVGQWCVVKAFLGSVELYLASPQPLTQQQNKFLSSHNKEEMKR